MKNRIPFTESEREKLVRAAQSVEASPLFDGFWEEVEFQLLYDNPSETDKVVQPRHYSK